MGTGKSIDEWLAGVRPTIHSDDIFTRLSNDGIGPRRIVGVVRRMPFPTPETVRFLKDLDVNKNTEKRILRILEDTVKRLNQAAQERGSYSYYNQNAVRNSNINKKLRKYRSLALQVKNDRLLPEDHRNIIMSIYKGMIIRLKHEQSQKGRKVSDIYSIRQFTFWKDAMAALVEHLTPQLQTKYQACIAALKLLHLECGFPIKYKTQGQIYQQARLLLRKRPA